MSIARPKSDCGVLWAEAPTAVMIMPRKTKSGITYLVHLENVSDGLRVPRRKAKHGSNFE